MKALDAWDDATHVWSDEMARNVKQGRVTTTVRTIDGDRTVKVTGLNWRTNGYRPPVRNGIAHTTHTPSIVTGCVERFVTEHTVLTVA